MNINETIDCLNDILFLFLSMKGCIDSKIENLCDGHFESVNFLIRMEDLLGDLNDLMTVYQYSMKYNDDIDFRYIHFLSMCKGVLEAYAGRTIIWCMRHKMPLKQLLFSMNELQDMYVREIQSLERKESKE